MEVNYKSRLSLVLIILTLSGIYSQVVADEYHYSNILIGNRASGLGGAYTAISDDATGLYYNPAGIVFLEGVQISASANAFHSTRLTYKDVLNGGDWNRESSNIIPNYFGMTSKLGDGYVGFSYAVTEFEVEDQDSMFTNIPNIPLFVININNNDKVTKLGPSYANSINDELNFGITLYLHQRDRDLVSNQWVRLADTSYEWSNLYFETSETGIEPVIGFMWSPDNEISFGLSMRKTIIMTSDSRTQSSCSSNINNPVAQSAQCIPNGGSPIDPTIIESSDKRKLPLNIRMGVAYFPSPDLLYSADVSWYEKVRSDSFDAEEVTNIALGVEYYFNPVWAIRGGYFTNNANTPEVSSSGQNQLDHVDLSGISMSMTRFSKSSSLTLGFVYSSGSGEAQVISGSNQVQDLEQSTQTIYLSTSYNF